MNSVRAIYENGVFRPLDAVNLPEASEVLLGVPEPLPKIDPVAMARVYEIMSRRYRSGEHDVAERHNEHQP